MAADKFEIPNASKRCYLVGEWQDTIAISDADAPHHFLIDLGSWPPKVEENKDSFVQHIEWARDGRRIVLDSIDLDDASYDIRAYRGEERVDCKRFEDERRYGFLIGVPVGDRIFAWPGHRSPYPKELPALEVGPLLWAEDKWLEPEGAEKIEFLPDAPVVMGGVALGDGTNLLIWQGDGYELKGDDVVKTLALAAEGSRADWTSVPAGDDGFFYLSARKLFEVHRGGDPKRHLQKQELDNIIRIAPGPGQTLLLRLGTNPLGALGAVYDPAANTIKALSAELLGQKRIEALRWSDNAGRLIAVGKRELTSLTSAELEALPTV